VASSSKLACLSLKKEADVDSGVIPEAFPGQETGFSESHSKWRIFTLIAPQL
jgi:hypothetical protein